jgi:hypothetical protein
MSNNLPRGDNAAGLEGYCSAVFADGFGKVKLVHKEREFEVDAGNAADIEIKSEIALFDKVIALFESDGYYFVMKSSELYTGIDTKF